MVIVSALPTDELLSVGLGQPMAARAFLRGIRRVCFDYHYAAQSGLVQNELEQLIERPLRLFGAAANLSLSNVLQFFQQDRKSTRLNSSHRCISYAVFCLKKKRYVKISSFSIVTGEI